jgi:hypothetical protein
MDWRSELRCDILLGMDEQPLHELADVFPGVATSRRASEGESAPDVRVIGVADITPDGSVGVRGLSTLPLILHGRRHDVQLGDLLLTCRGTTLKVGMVGQEAVGATATSNVLVVRCHPDRLLPEVLFAWWRSRVGTARLLDRTRSSTTLISLTAEEVRTIGVPTPPMFTQHQIADLVRASRSAHQLAVQAAEERLRLAEHAILSLLPDDLNTPRRTPLGQSQTDA